MKRMGIVAVLFLTAWLARGDETPQMQLDFVRKLRDKGYTDLALEYLEAWQKKAPPEMKSILPMEMARTRIALARDKPPEQRLALIKVARGELQAFVKSYADKPEGVQARLELARLDTQEGKAVLSKALRNEDIKTQQSEAKAAENLFVRAGQELDAAAKQIGALATSYKDPDPKREQLIKEQLAQDLLQARLDRGMNLMEQSRTYIDLSNEAVNLQRAQVIDQAKKIFEKLAKDEDIQNPVCGMAAAWMIRCNQEGQAPKEAMDYFKAVMNPKNKVPTPAKRWARYFYLQGILKDATDKRSEVKKLAATKDEALKWLAAYPNQANAPEGQGVRWELANCYIKEALIAGKNDLNSPKAAPILAKAQKLLASLAEGDSDYAEQANQLNLTLNVGRIAKVPIASLNGFDDIYLKGHYEWNQVKKVVSKLAAPDLKEEEKKKLVKERHDGLENVIKAFTLALRKADNRTPVGKKDDARFFRVMAFLELGDLHRAAVAGEALARQQPPRKRSAAAAGYALEAYASILARDSNDDNRERLLNLANFILKDQGKYWAHEPVTPVSRYKLAMAFQRDANFKDAVEQLEQLNDSFPGFTYAQGQLVLVALEAGKKTKDDKEKKYFHDKAVAALKRIPKLPATVDPATADMFFKAQMEYPKLLFGEAASDVKKNDLVNASAKYKEMAASIKQLQDQLLKVPVKLSPKTLDRLTFALGFLEKYSRLGQAEIEYRKGNFDAVLSPPLTGAVVAEVQKLGAKAGPIPMAEYEVVGNILGLALRASVQKGKIAEAKTVLGLIQRLTSEGGNFADRTGVLQTLVQDVEVQVRALKKANDPAKLKAFVGNFSGLVDELAKGADKKGNDSTTSFFLARLYDILEQHEKAADLYAKIPPPHWLKTPKGQPFDKDEEKNSQAEKEVQTYWYSRVQYARQLRQIGGEKKKEHLELANKVLNELLQHPHARGQQLAEKEKIFILQEKEIYGGAATQWDKLMKNPALVKQMANGDQNAKESYFDAYYQMTYCLYKYSRTDAAKSRKLDKAYLRRAADYIFKLEIASNSEGWELLRPRFVELMESELPLRDMVEELKKNQKKKTAK